MPFFKRDLRKQHVLFSEVFEEKVPKQKVRSSFSGVYLHTSGQDNHVPTTVLVLLPFGQEKRRSCLPHCNVAGLEVQVVTVSGTV